MANWREEDIAKYYADHPGLVRPQGKENTPTMPAKPTSVRGQAQNKGTQTIIAESMSEQQLCDAVIELAHYYGWLVAHFRPALLKNGTYRTAVQGDGKGFYDIILKRYTPENGYQWREWELKSEKGKLTEAQEEWQKVSPFAEVIRPSDWLSGAIQKSLDK